MKRPSLIICKSESITCCTRQHEVDSTTLGKMGLCAGFETCNISFLPRMSTSGGRKLQILPCFDPKLTTQRLGRRKGRIDILDPLQPPEGFIRFPPILLQIGVNCEHFQILSDQTVHETASTRSCAKANGNLPLPHHTPRSHKPQEKSFGNALKTWGKLRLDL